MPATIIGTVRRSVLIEQPDGPKLNVGPKVKSWICLRYGAEPGDFSKNWKLVPRYGYLPSRSSRSSDGGVYWSLQSLICSAKSLSSGRFPISWLCPAQEMMKSAWNDPCSVSMRIPSLEALADFQFELVWRLKLGCWFARAQVSGGMPIRVLRI